MPESPRSPTKVYTKADFFTDTIIHLIAISNCIFTIITRAGRFLDIAYIGAGKIILLRK